jgi:hypothetical protein
MILFVCCLLSSHAVILQISLAFKRPQRPNTDHKRLVSWDRPFVKEEGRAMRVLRARLAQLRRGRQRGDHSSNKGESGGYDVFGL